MTIETLIAMCRAYVTQQKVNHPDRIIFMRIGDFYEAYNDDARTIAKALELTLTTSKGTPLAGIAYHSFERYASKLLRAGHKIGLCERVEEDNSFEFNLFDRDGESMVITRPDGSTNTIGLYPE
jgi:DNA mismatch repair protein MutS